MQLCKTNYQYFLYLYYNYQHYQVIFIFNFYYYQQQGLGLALQQKMKVNINQANMEERQRDDIKQKKMMGWLPPIIYMQRAKVGLDDSADAQNANGNALKNLGIDNIIENDFDPLQNQALFIAEPKQLVEEELTEEEKQDPTKMFGNLFGSGFISLTMNTKYVFFFNTFHVWYMDITNPHKGFNKLSLVISPAEAQSQIKKVRTGNAVDKICIQVRQNEQQDALILWDLKDDEEIEAFDVSNDPHVFWDSKGDPYVVDGNKLLIMSQGVNFTCFDIQDIIIEDERAKQTKKILKFGYEYGNRFDFDGHSWLFLRDYINLSYSYMTFVIKKKFDDEEVDYTNEEFLFDLEQYNYLIQGRTALTETKLATADHDRLQYILQNFKEIDPVLLEQIQYYHIERNYFSKNASSLRNSIVASEIDTGSAMDIGKIQSLDQDKLNPSDIESLRSSLKASQAEDQVSMSQLRDFEKVSKNLNQQQRKRLGFEDVKVTPLYYAFQQRNNRSVKILLQYMGALDYNASHNVKKILPDLIDFAGFREYLMGIPFQTLQMQSKQTLRVKQSDLETIVKINSSKTSYVDREYYIEKMGEESRTSNILDFTDSSDFKNYPVKIEALRADWILDQDGKRFFKNILQSEQLDIYSIPAIQMFIEYLYIQVKQRIWVQRFYPYVLQVAVYYALIYLFEVQFKTVQVIPENTLQLQLKDPNSSGPGSIAIILAIVNIFTSLYPFYFLYKQSKHLKQQILTNVFFYIDLIGCIMSIYISICIFFNAGIKDNKPQTGWHHYRVVAAINCIMVISKSLYFLKLFDRIAPLIFIIVKIIKDIQYFMYVFFIIQFSFMVAFYLMGQVQVDQIPDKKDDIRYASPLGAFQYMWYISIGELSADDNMFDISDNIITQIILWVLFIAATFLVLIHMLNMLIAVMTETFTVNNENKQETRLKEHLQFVVDNWFTLKSKTKSQQTYANYLVAAWAYEEDEEEVEILKDLQDEVINMRQNSKEELAQILTEIKKIKSKINDRNKEIDP